LELIKEFVLSVVSSSSHVVVNIIAAGGFMIVNFRARETSRDILKLIRTSTLIKKKTIAKTHESHG
jgi:hypothetical protein